MGDARKLIIENALVEEKVHVETLLDECKGVFTKKDKELILTEAKKYCQDIRVAKTSGMESFINQYNLSNQEGVAIMCLAESLLRIPDSKTAKELINDKLKGKQWKEHLNKSDSTFVNASTWGLLLTGGVVNLSDSKSLLLKTISKIGEPVILNALKKAMHIISNQFIIGADIKSSLKRSSEQDNFRFSFDILGESSRTQKQADNYYQQYIQAIDEISLQSPKDGDLHDWHNISVKLSALHPRVELMKLDRLKQELMPRLIEMVAKCRDCGITISFDAEEAYRLDAYLEILQELISLEEFKDYNGIGFVVQAYQKRAFYVIDLIAELAERFGKSIPVRLVKGAYWDYEIKRAQELGLEEYPVFTRKEYTDLSYIICALKIKKCGDLIYPQFATHNAHTVAMIKHLFKGKKFEFQKLQGMGDALYTKIIDEGFKCRVYAPVGDYKDLLAYLMRRLLENGANTSFVNLIGDKETDVEEIVFDPVERVKELVAQDSSIVLPRDIFGAERANSMGYDIGFYKHYNELQAKVRGYKKQVYKVASIVAGKQDFKKSAIKDVVSPLDGNDIVGQIANADDKLMLEGLSVSADFFDAWEGTEVARRAELIYRVGDVLHENRYKLYSLLIREAGKNIDDAIAEVREAIDFARYYAKQALKLHGEKITLPSCTGELNQLSLHGRGVFLCISPWNFPLAIFMGQILAALAAGNTVVAKPASNTCIIANVAVKCIHEAGIPEEALQLLIGSGRKLAELLLPDNRITGVCFTGSTDTAQSINRSLAMREGNEIPMLIAETGGQNAMIVDSSALLEQATDDIVISAFGSVGQRCSALRVLYIQEEIYPELLEMIKGAMDQLSIGDTEDLSVDLGAVIDRGARQELQNHIMWAKNSKKSTVKLLAHHKDKNLLEGKRGSFLAPHIIEIASVSELTTERFGPILHVISYKAKDLDKVIDQINATGFGLTFGVHSRIEDKIKYIASKVKAGNIYANRSMIGAQVGVQPFGGERASGTGFKAGGQHYLLKFSLERCLTINTTAIGGNIELLSGS